MKNTVKIKMLSPVSLTFGALYTGEVYKVKVLATSGAGIHVKIEGYPFKKFLFASEFAFVP